jgi:membrane protein DedA with SNARE-associated domain
MAQAAKKITRDDIEQKLREVAGDVDTQVEVAKPKILAGAIAAGVAALLIAYLLGRRGGRNRSAKIEIRRL